MCKLVVLLIFVALTNAEKADISHGMLILGKIARQYLNSQANDVKLGDGVHLVSVRSENDARANTDDKTFLGAIENYMLTHEIRIKLPELMPGEGFARSFNDALQNIEGKDEGNLQI